MLPDNLSITHKITRRKFLFAAGAAGLAAFAGDGLWQSTGIRVRQFELPLRRLPKAFDGYKIAQLSDFHYDETISAGVIHKAAAIVNSLHPDLTVLTGDFITAPIFARERVGRKAVATATPCAEVLGTIQSPKYAVLGNHDAMSNPPFIIRELERNGIPVMRNQSTALERGNARVWLAGIDDLLHGMPRTEVTLTGIPSDEVTILLAHEPDFADRAARFPVDLQLSGHSHGGQVWIPGIGAPWLPPMSRKYPRGLYRINDLTLYTNMGIGTIHVPIRLNCPPEVTLITLRSGQS